MEVKEEAEEDDDLNARQERLLASLIPNKVINQLGSVGVAEIVCLQNEDDDDDNEEEERQKKSAAPSGLSSLAAYSSSSDSD